MAKTTLSNTLTTGRAEASRTRAPSPRQPSRHVEEANDPDGRVHAEPRELAARPTNTPLQEIVHQALRHPEVVESAIESPLADVGKDLAPTGRDGLYQVAIEDVVVEEEHLLVEPLPRVVVVREVLLRVGDRR